MIKGQSIIIFGLPFLNNCTSSLGILQAELVDDLQCKSDRS